MTATRFDETKHRRHGKGTRQGGRFAPKPAPQAAAVAAPQQLWHLLLWSNPRPKQVRQVFNPHKVYAPNSTSRAHRRWTATAPSAREAIRGQLKEAARKMGMDKSSLAGLNPAWMDGLIVGHEFNTRSASAGLPLIPTGDVTFYLTADTFPPAPSAKRSPLPRGGKYRTPSMLLPEAEKLAHAAGLDRSAARSVSLAAEILERYMKQDSPHRPTPGAVCPDNPGLLIETLAHHNRRRLLYRTLGGTDLGVLGDGNRCPQGLLESGFYTRLLTEMPYDPFTGDDGHSRSLAVERGQKMMYRPAIKYMNTTWPRESVGETLLRAAAATYGNSTHPETLRHKTDALVAAARRSEMGAVVGFTTKLFPPDSGKWVPPVHPVVEAAVARLLENPSNRWCDPDDFRRRIVTLSICAYMDKLCYIPDSQITAAIFEKLDAALKVVAGEPDQPVTQAEAECVRTLLIERGRLIERGELTDTERPYQPSAPLTYSTLSRLQQMSCAHHARPEMAIPDASKKLAARMGDYARWVAAHDNRKAGRLVAALLTVPDLPPQQVAGLFVLLQKTLEQAAGR